MYKSRHLGVMWCIFPSRLIHLQPTKDSIQIQIHNVQNHRRIRGHRPARLCSYQCPLRVQHSHSSLYHTRPFPITSCAFFCNPWQPARSQNRTRRQNYMDEPDKVFLDNGLGKGGVWGVFSVQGYVSEDVEWKQAKAIADASKAIEVKHFVYSGVSFGTLVNDPPLAFAVKRKVEQYIESINLPHTFLRPTQFMDNLLPTSPFLFKVSRTILLRRTFYNHPERKHQMVSCRDIGQMGALAFANPHQSLGKAVDLAGDEFTMEELEKRYEGIMGAPIQLTFGVLAGFVRWMVAPLGSMANFYDDYGYSINIPELRKDMPELEDLDAFLKRYKGAIESKE
ncbi:hypothetical protein L202_04825 [Cryptococcus amylolentus CBS 6039]|uniref:NmrA-like domain-containing protein n=1 Tax=Cryptococcus amylolentus CBS 6039 TaxID=1295533 RepID=A0A1E3HNF9_9TREE|nr:hypothetical protein L202_04825 [Cryptococcus amylolentus CBS 6039]ODN77675.1 hypothetical protein L202_04825 [Cryptococcus amylolentus CBS 6039]